MPWVSEDQLMECQSSTGANFTQCFIGLMNGLKGISRYERVLKTKNFLITQFNYEGKLYHGFYDFKQGN